MNDPNGLVRVNGRWHVFFQHNPKSSTAAAICWGHMSSADLLTWRSHPLALVPRRGEADRYGCWSGVARIVDGMPLLYYSAVEDASGLARVLRADPVDERLDTWAVRPEVVADVPPIAGLLGVRDPFVFEAFGSTYAIQGAGTAGDGPSVLVYRADDPDRWTPAGVLLDASDPVAVAAADADIWECPQLVRLGDEWLLVVSVWRNRDGTRTLHGAVALFGTLDLDADGVPRFHARTGGPLDESAVFYAPQLLVDGDRVLCWGWCREVDGATPAGRPWAGLLSVPREIERSGDGGIAVRPARELDGLRAGSWRVLGDGHVLGSPSETLIEAQAQTTLRLTVPGGVTRTFLLGAGEWARILTDLTVCEMFVAGRPSYTARVDDGADPLLVLTGQATVTTYALRTDGRLDATAEASGPG